MFDLELTLDPAMPSGHLYISMSVDGEKLHVTVSPNWQPGDAKLLLALDKSLAEAIADGVSDAAAAAKSSDVIPRPEVVAALRNPTAPGAWDLIKTATAAESQAAASEAEAAAQRINPRQP